MATPLELLGTAAAEYTAELIEPYDLTLSGTTISLIYRPTGEVVETFDVFDRALPLPTLVIHLTLHSMINNSNNN